MVVEELSENRAVTYTRHEGTSANHLAGVLKRMGYALRANLPQVNRVPGLVLFGEVSDTDIRGVLRNSDKSLMVRFTRENMHPANFLELRDRVVLAQAAASNREGVFHRESMAVSGVIWISDAGQCILNVSEYQFRENT